MSRSADLVTWTALPGRLRGLSGRSGPLLNLTLDERADSAFFRVTALQSTNTATGLGDGGAEVFGYGAQFEEELERLGLLSLEQFEATVQEPPYLPAANRNPTTAQYWTNFYQNPEFRLNSAELTRFRANGFVVSERLGMSSFGGLYYRIFHGDLPVFVTVDSVLQAWHRTYANLLEELEEVELATLAEQVITNMANQLPPLWQKHGTGPLQESLLDADYFLTVAQSLWAGAQVPPSIPWPGQEQRVASTLTDIDNLSLRQVPLFGSDRWMDFSQFQVRGHYTDSERLRRYFRTMIWCSRTDLQLATSEPNATDDIRQLGTAVVLYELLRESGQFTNWSAVEDVTRSFVGVTDSMTFGQMGELLTQAGIASLNDVRDRLTLTNLQTRLLTGELGMQSITSDVLFAPLSPELLKLPRSFAFFGQKFVLDSWALGQVVFDKVHWPSEDSLALCGATNLNGKVVRRKPTCLDIAFSVLGNDQVGPEIVSRIERTNGAPFRDGLPYQHNLAAVRAVVERQAAEAWTNSIYMAWLGALRQLSAPSTASAYPEPMRTRAWGMKTLSTQLASWTELRHDTLLYAKQSYTPPVVCSYPYGFVEPRPEFWHAMKTLADVAASAISKLPSPVQVVTIPGRIGDWYGGPPRAVTCSPQGIKQNQITALNSFSATMTVLETIARKELNQEPLTSAEDDFLISTMEYLGICREGELGYTGWYPALFYQNVFWADAVQTFNDNNPFHEQQGCVKFDALVTDVHTDLPDEVVCDPGAVIHEAIGNAHLLLVAVDNGPDYRVYAGPVFSHYEFELPGINRMTDEEWKTQLTTGTKPAAPDWTRSYLAQSGWGYDDLAPRPNVVGWGANDSGQLDVPDNLTNAVYVGGHGLTALAVRDDGTVAAWGRNTYGETQVPAKLANVVAVTGSVSRSAAITSDGSVVEWGNGATNMPAGLTNIVALDSTHRCSIAITADGKAIVWGDGALAVPPNLDRTVAVSVDPAHGLALKQNGTVLAWADINWGGSHDGEAAVPPGLSNVVAVAAGTAHSLALKADGTVVGWGSDNYGQISLFRGVSNLVAIAAGWYHSVGLKADGTVICSKGFTGVAGKVPLSLTNVVSITAGDEYALALVGTAPPVTEVPLLDPTYGPEGFTTSIESQIGRVYRLEFATSNDGGEWQGLQLLAGTGRTLKLTDTGSVGQERHYRVRRW